MPWVDLSQDVESMFGNLYIPIVQGEEWAGYHQHSYLETTRRTTQGPMMPKRELAPRKSRAVGGKRGRPRGTSDPRKVLALSMLAQNIAARQVAEKLGVDKTTVARWRREGVAK